MEFYEYVWLDAADVAEIIHELPESEVSEALGAQVDEVVELRHDEVLSFLQVAISNTHIHEERRHLGQLTDRVARKTLKNADREDLLDRQFYSDGVVESFTGMRFRLDDRHFVAVISLFKKLADREESTISQEAGKESHPAVLGNIAVRQKKVRECRQIVWQLLSRLPAEEQETLIDQI